MRKLILPSVVFLSCLLTTSTMAQDKHVKATLESVGGSGVSGSVQLTQMPHGGSNLHVMARGLIDGTVYSSFYYESDNCSAPADLLETFTANGGQETASGKIDEDVDEVGSVSVRLGAGYGDLLACAVIPHQR